MQAKTENLHMNIGPILRRIRHSKRMTLVQTTEGTGIGVSLLSRIEREGLPPSFENMVKLSQKLGFSLDAIAAEAHDQNLAEVHSIVARQVPVISWELAAVWEESPYLTDPASCHEWLEAPKKCGKNSFALQVHDDIMTTKAGASFPDGSYIIVDPDVEPHNNSMIVACLDGSDKATFKQLIHDTPHYFLKPLNPQYPVLPVNQGMRVIGTVIDVSFKDLIA